MAFVVLAPFVLSFSKHYLVFIGHAQYLAAAVLSIWHQFCFVFAGVAQYLAPALLRVWQLCSLFGTSCAQYLEAAAAK